MRVVRYKRMGLGAMIVVFMAPCALFGIDDLEVVTVTGQGISADAARRDAFRNALEQGGKMTIASHSEVANFELIKDTIVSRAQGIISGVKILEESEGAGGVHICKLRATVNKRSFASTWAEVQMVLDQVGRPGIAVYIDERIDGVRQPDSILEARIEKRLLDAGFSVYSGSQLRAIAEKESEDAASIGDVAKMQRIAKNFGTQIFITGTAQADSAGVRELAGQLTAMYNCSATLRMYYTDTAKLITSESLPNTRGGARGERELSVQAGKKALSNAGDALVEQCYESVMQRWATRITAGGELELEISGINAVEALKFRQTLFTVDPDKIRSVNQSFSKGTATYHIIALMTAQDLAEHLVAEKFASQLELVDIQANRLQAKWRK